MARLVRARLVPASLTGRVFALYAAALVAVVAAMGLLFYRYQFTDAVDGAVSSAQALADVMLPAISDSAVIGDFDTIKRTLAKATRQANIAKASFLAAQGGRIVVGTRSPASWSPAWLRQAVAGRLGEVNTVVAVGGVDYGVMRLSFDTAGISGAIWAATLQAMELLVVALAVALIAMRWLLRRWLAPLEHMGRPAGSAADVASARRALSGAPTEVAQAVEAFERTEAALLMERVTAAATLGAVGDAVITIDPRGRILYANPAAIRLFGLADGASGRQLQNLVPSPLGIVQGDATIGAWDRADLVLPPAPAIGRERAIHLETTMTPIVDAAGATVGHALTCHDVTANKSYESQLTGELAARQSAMQSLREALGGMLAEAELLKYPASEKDLQSVALLVADLVRQREISRRELDNRIFALDQHAAVSIADAGGTITYANQRMVELGGYTEAELIGANHRLLSSGLHEPDFYRDIWRTITSGRVWHGEIANRHKNGSLYWVATTIVPWLDENRQPSQYIAIRTDITRRKEVEAALRSEKQLLEESKARELQTGYQIQRALLIGEVPPGIHGADIAGYAVPSKGIDGDFYVFTRFRPDCFEIAFGDVMGKGVPAALVGAGLRTSYNQVVTELVAASAHDDRLPEPAAIVNALHRRLTSRLIELDTFVTLALYRFDLAQGRLTFVNAGHTAGLLRRRGGTVERLLGDNLPLGVLAKERYQEGTTAISAGDALLVYSDGISEARSAQGEELGESGLQGLLAGLEVGAMPSHAALQVLRRRLHERIGASTGSDDETAVLIRVAEVSEGAAADTDAGAALMELPWDLAHLGRLRERVEAAAAVLPTDAADRLVLASFEAASNVVRHVVPPFDGATLLCRTRRDRGGVTVELWYVGAGFEPMSAPLPDLSGASEGGFGLYIIEKSVSHVAYEQPAPDVCCTRLVQMATGVA
jgi:PAS domain S-box-containing protein